MVAFGTGQNLTDGDRSDRSSVQSFYSVLDDANYELEASGANKGKVKTKTGTTATTVKMSDLVQRTFDYTPIKGGGANSDETFFKMNKVQEELNYKKDSSGNQMRGWYINFPAGQRVLATPTFYDADILEITHETPTSGGNVAEESCSPPTMEGKQYFTYQGIEFGLAPTTQLVDVNGDGLFNADDGGASSGTSKYGKLIKIPGGSKKITGKELCPTPADCPPEFGQLPKPPLTINWRQLQ